MESRNFNIVKTTDKTDSFRVKKLVGMFELNQSHLSRHFVGQMDFPENWNIGMIVGRSGTGKSTIAKEFFNIFETKYTDKPVIDEVSENKTVEDITKTFTQVGFSSPPSWLNKYSVLSNGEKMRVDLTKALLSDQDIICFDEFTSVVDRDVAKICSMVIQKNIRKNNRKFVAVSCHYDVAEWLEPDWIFSTDEMKMLKVKKKDQNYKSLFTKETENIGKCLRTITI